LAMSLWFSVEMRRSLKSSREIGQTLGATFHLRISLTASPKLPVGRCQNNQREFATCDHLRQVLCTLVLPWETQKHSRQNRGEGMVQRLMVPSFVPCALAWRPFHHFRHWAQLGAKLLEELIAPSIRDTSEQSDTPRRIFLVGFLEDQSERQSWAHN
jgi:hypothetical protein